MLTITCIFSFILWGEEVSDFQGLELGSDGGGVGVAMKDEHLERVLPLCRCVFMYAEARGHSQVAFLRHPPLYV